MQISDIRTHYEYLFWAHERMMATVALVPQEDFVRDLGSSHGSLRGTLVHLMSAEWLYLSRWHGVFPDQMLSAESFPDMTTLEARWSGIRRELRSFLGRLRAENLTSAFLYRNLRGDEISLPLYVTLLHVVNHNTYHRGQVVSLLRMLGQRPESTDLYRFYLENQVLEASEYEDPGLPILSPREPDGEEEEPSEDLSDDGRTGGFA